MLTYSGMMALIAIRATPGNALQDTLRPLTDFAARYPEALWVLGVSSFVLLIGSALALPTVVRRLPEDYLLRRRGLASERPLARRLLLGSMRNVAAVVLVLAGIAMLVLPGQGILTIIAGIAVSTVPGKRQVLRWLACRPLVLRALNRIRTRGGLPPFRVP